MEKQNYKQIGIWIVLTIVFGWLGFRYLLPILLPFFIGFLISRAAEPLIRALQRNKTLPRWVCSAASMTLIYILLGVGLFFLLRAMLRELETFVNQLPELLASLSMPMSKLKGRMFLAAEKLPDGVGDAVTAWIDNLFASGSVILETLYNWLFNFVTGIIRSVPSLLLFLITAILSSFMFSSQWPILRKQLLGRLPARWRAKVQTVTQHAKTAMGGWLRAQAKLLLICFGLLTLGLWILGTQFPLLFGGIIALIDALPVLGSGTVLLPWAILDLAQGHSSLAIGLIILYCVVSLTRTSLEPRLLGAQIGLSPLVTLFALYAGFRLMGIGGMILFPIGAIMVKQLTQLWETGKK